MKNVKRLVAGALALALVLGMTLSVMGAEVPSITPTDNTPEIVDDGSYPTEANPSDDGGYYYVKSLEEKPEDLNGVDATSLAAIQAVNAVGAGVLTDGFIEDVAGAPGADAITSALEGLKWLTTFFTIGYVDTVPAHNDVTLKINVEGISNYANDDIVVVHYDEEKSTWELLDHKVLENDELEVTMPAFSPVAVAVKPAEGEDVPSGKSPKTGMANSWEMFALAAAGMAVCGAFLLRGKRA